MEWHRQFGLLLMDFFTGSPFEVEVEQDLSHQQQRLDVVILRKGKGRFAERLPDGLDNLAAYNLITFKSYKASLNDWALKELTGHYVAYRKLVKPARGQLLPETDFKLYAVCCRYPHNLAGAVTLEPVQQGVYDCRRGSDLIRVIVARQLPEAEHNAPLYLFSGLEEQVAYGARHYRQRSPETSSLLHQLFERYQREGVTMSYTMEDFRRDYAKEHLEKLSLEERLAGLPLKEIEEYVMRSKEVAASSPERKKGNRRGRRQKR